MEGRGVPKRGLCLPTESRTEAGEGKHGLEHRLSRPRGLELQDVRTGQRTGGPTALPLSRSRCPGSLCTSLPSPRLISMPPPASPPPRASVRPLHVGSHQQKEQRRGAQKLPGPPLSPLHAAHPPDAQAAWRSVWKVGVPLLYPQLQGRPHPQQLWQRQPLPHQLCRGQAGPGEGGLGSGIFLLILFFCLSYQLLRRPFAAGETNLFVDQMGRSGKKPFTPRAGH